MHTALVDHAVLVMMKLLTLFTVTMSTNRRVLHRHGSRWDKNIYARKGRKHIKSSLAEGD
jgi:hypothetical protein